MGLTWPHAYRPQSRQQAVYAAAELTLSAGGANDLWPYPRHTTILLVLPVWVLTELQKASGTAWGQNRQGADRWFCLTWRKLFNWIIKNVTEWYSDGLFKWTFPLFLSVTYDRLIYTTWEANHVSIMTQHLTFRKALLKYACPTHITDHAKELATTITISVCSHTRVKMVREPLE